MKTLLTLATMAFIGVLGMPSGASADEMAKDAMMMDKAKPTVVAFHSDNCGKCKILAPKLMGAVNEAGDSVNFVKFDYTNRETIGSSKILAAEKGLSDLQKKYGAKTGFAVIVDGEGNETKINSSDSQEEILALLQ